MIHEEWNLDDLVMKTEDYRRLGIPTPEEREAQKALPKIGDPGYTVDDLAITVEKARELGLQSYVDLKAREAEWEAYRKQHGAIWAEEDLQLHRRGKPNRHFKSKNIVDLVQYSGLRERGKA